MKKRWADLTDEERKEIGRKISNTKNTPEGKLKTKLAYQKCKDIIVSKLKGRSPSNKMDDSQRILVECLNCGKEELLVPCIAKKKKFCCRECKNEYRRGRPAENWNINSAIKNNSGGKGISGKYKGIRFRSSYELSFLVRAFQLGHDVVAEPICIKIWDYLSSVNREAFDIPPNRRYIPDYLLNGKCLVEIKPEISLLPESESFPLVIAKLIALEEYCKQNNLDYMLLTDEDMGKLILSTRQICSLPKNDLVFFKEKHRERFG
jgi:hypothetical protein